MRAFVLTPLLASLAGALLVEVTKAPSQQGLSISNPKILASWDYSDCGSYEYAIVLKTLSVSPDPPVRGQDLTITATGTARRKIEEGAYADVTVKLGLIKLIQKQFDVCEEARNANASVQCPIEEGEYEVTQTVTLPREIPPAKFTVNVRGYTVDDDDMLCVDLKADFTPKV
ncbi:ML domain-containing protein [Mycena pura]|uniref:Phosphatidylglycerol/phosphatidylinositol transfer protein n=1 Tax=Mycena pura TaxID=153505 RepID=A0AAD6UK85_9AGAR|nr:ML domain-containing protein [Mycena pura]